MAFAKTPKQIGIAICLLALKLDKNIKSKKIRIFQFPAQRHFSAWTANCQESNPGLLLNFQPPGPTSQTLKWKNAIFTCLWNHSVLQNGELSFSSAEWLAGRADSPRRLACCCRAKSPPAAAAAAGGAAISTHIWLGCEWHACSRPQRGHPVAFVHIHRVYQSKISRARNGQHKKRSRQMT